MCGIAGYIGKNPPTIDYINLTSKILEHRGPDQNGVYNHKFKDQKTILLHRRLSIIDLDIRSNQPFFYKGTVLIFNGEIYNYLEIREKLKDLGHNFQTFGDTEVLIHSLYQWGEQALEKLEGMWAFAWYNEINGTIILSRDRFGEKPLYFWKKNKGFYFASEIKGLSTLANVSPNINQNHLIRNLVNGYKSLYKSKETFFEEVEEVSPGTCLKINFMGKEISKRFWKPKFEVNEKLNYEDSVSMIKEKLVNAVKLRMRSDVPND